MGNHKSLKGRQQKRKEKCIFYVSVNGNDAWSGRLAIANGSRTDGPFATISKARDAIRRLNTKGKLTSPITVYIRGGLYELPETLVFSPKDSGTQEYPITYTAYPDETPIISGGRKINNWKQEKSGLWKTIVPGVREGKWYFRQLFVNGRRRYRARLPKKGFYRVGEVLGVDLKKPFSIFHKLSRKFRFKTGDIKSTWTNLRDVEVVLLHYWNDSHLPIATVNKKTRIVTFTRSPFLNFADDHKPKVGARYYVDNVFEGLHEPGEWYLNPRTGAIYYLPESGEKIDKAEIIAPYLSRVVSFEGDPENKTYVEYITLRGLTFCHNNFELPADDAGDYQAAFTLPGAIYGRGMCNCAIEQCKIKNIGTYGIELAGGCDKNRLIQNEISESAGGGIKLFSGDMKELWQHAVRDITGCGKVIFDEYAGKIPFHLRTGNTQVTDNHLHHLGQIYHSAVGILVLHSSENNISHNHIHDLYYTGISVGWIWAYKPITSVDNRIEFNYIHHIGHGLLSETGGIYTLGVSPGTVIRNNLVHDIETYHHGAIGIWLDEGSSHIVIENNIVYNTNEVIFGVNIGRENIVRNNIFAFGGSSQFGCGPTTGHIAFTFEKNIVITDGQLLCKARIEDKLRNFISDLNLFWDISKKNPVLGRLFLPKVRVAGADVIYEHKNKDFKMADWQKLGYDLHSVIADPGCKDYQKRNFTLKKNSPAWKLGFQPIDMSQVGPRRNLRGISKA